MRLELFEVRFDNANSIYTAGQPVTGKVIIKIAKATWIDSKYFLLAFYNNEIKTFQLFVEHIGH